MSLETVLVIILSCFILLKVKAIVERNNLNSNGENKLLICATLTILFLITNVTLPYPESLYWFIGLSIASVSTILTYDIITREFKRFMKSDRKERAINVLFYSLLLITINLFL